MKNSSFTTLGVLVIVALGGPLILLPISQLFPYPHLIEEFFKLALLIPLVRLEKERHRSYGRWVLVLGFLFTLSESMFYVMNLLLLNRLGLFATRFPLTLLLHVSTLLIIYTGLKRKWLILPALAVAIMIHYLYNSSIAYLVP